MQIDFDQVHLKCGWHEKDIRASKTCGCFGCLAIFAPVMIKEWIDEADNSPRGPGKTAICPKCGMDAVLPDNTGYPVNVELLEAMHERFLSSTKSVSGVQSKKNKAPKSMFIKITAMYLIITVVFVGMLVFGLWIKSLKADANIDSHYYIQEIIKIAGVNTFIYLLALSAAAVAKRRI